MYGVALALLVLLSFPAFAQNSAANQTPNAGYVPDVVILVFSGVLPTDSISCTYNRVGVSKEEAGKDVQTLAGITKQSFSGVQISSRALPPSKDVQTSSEFQASGLVDYTRGGLIMEPFISAFKRFKNIEINYIVNGKFTFRGLSDYEDKHVSIKMLKPYQYRITVKDAGFDTLNLPIIQPQTPQGGGAESTGSSKWPVAFVIALVAGTAVFFGAKRLGKK